FAVFVGGSFLEIAFEMVDDAFEIQALCGAAVRGIAVENQILHAARKLFEWRAEIEAVRESGEFERALKIRGTAARAESAFEERLRPVDDNFSGIEIVFRAKAVTFGARAIGRIEAEGTRFERGNGNAAVGAGEFFRVHLLFAADDGDGDKAVGEFGGCLDGLLEALGNALFDEQAVDDDFDGVVAATVERGRFVEIHKIAVDARTNEPSASKFLEFFFVLAFASANNGSEDHDAFVGTQRKNGLDNLLGGLARDGLAAIGAMWRADGTVNHAQVIVNFRDGADGGARRPRGGFLLDGDGGRKAFDGIDLRALHLVEELARVGGKRFDVAALALGVESVKRKRGLARAGKPGDDGERVARDFEIDVLEIVLARAANDDLFESHVERGPHRRGRRTARRIRPR